MTSASPPPLLISDAALSCGATFTSCDFNLKSCDPDSTPLARRLEGEKEEGEVAEESVVWRLYCSWREGGYRNNILVDGGKVTNASTVWITQVQIRACKIIQSVCVFCSYISKASPSHTFLVCLRCSKQLFLLSPTATARNEHHAVLLRATYYSRGWLTCDQHVSGRYLLLTG